MLYIVIYYIYFLLFFLCIFKYPSVSLSAVILMFGIEQWAQSSSYYFILNNTLTNYITGGLVILSIFIKIVKRESIFANYPIVGWLVISLFIYSFLTLSWSSIPEISVSLWKQAFPYIILVILLSPSLFSSTGDLSKAFTVVIFAGTLLVLILLFDSNWTYRGVQLAGSGARKLMGNPLAIAETGAYVMLAAAFMNFSKGRRLWSVLRWISVAAGLALAVKSGSRGQFFAMVFVFFFFYAMGSNRQNLSRYFALLAGFVIFGSITYWIFEVFNQAEAGRWDSALMEHDVAGRWRGSIVLLKEWLESPLTIVFGLGNSASYDPKLLGIYPHVVALEVLGEEGLVGFALFLAILAMTIWNSLRSLSLAEGSSHKKGVVVTLSAITLFLLIISFKQGSLLRSLAFFASTIYLGKLKNILMEEEGRELD